MRTATLTVTRSTPDLNVAWGVCCAGVAWSALGGERAGRSQDSHDENRQSPHARGILSMRLPALAIVMAEQLTVIAAVGRPELPRKRCKSYFEPSPELHCHWSLISKMDSQSFGDFG